MKDIMQAWDEEHFRRQAEVHALTKAQDDWWTNHVAIVRRSREVSSHAEEETQ